jgi:PAS domain S-box-containing protein
LKLLASQAAISLENARLYSDLRHADAYLAEAQRLSHTGSFGWNVSSGEIFWSEETFRIFGFDRSVKPTLEHVTQRVHPEDAERVQHFIERAARDGGDYDREHRLLMPDGSVKHLLVVAHATKDDEVGLAFVGAVMDVTATKRAEEAMHQAQAELAHVTRVTTLGELAASIAHEVNQPLTGIVINGAASLRWLNHQPPALDETRSSVESMIKDAQRASEVIHRVRALSKKTEPEKAALDINDVIQEGVRLMQREVFGHATSLRLELASALPPVVGDRVQLQQVIINLAINAIQAMTSVPERQRELLIRSQAVESDQVSVEVVDAGARGPFVQGLLHHQGGRHGHGTVDLPLDHRGPWRTDVRRQQCRAGGDVSIHPAVGVCAAMTGDAGATPHLLPSSRQELCQDLRRLHGVLFRKKVSPLYGLSFYVVGPLAPDSQ